MEKHNVYLEMRLKIEDVFEHSAAQSEYYKQANTTMTPLGTVHENQRKFVLP